MRCGVQKAAGGAAQVIISSSSVENASRMHALLRCCALHDNISRGGSPFSQPHLHVCWLIDVEHARPALALQLGCRAATAAADAAR